MFSYITASCHSDDARTMDHEGLIWRNRIQPSRLPTCKLSFDLTLLVTTTVAIDRSQGVPDRDVVFEN